MFDFKKKLAEWMVRYSHGHWCFMFKNYLDMH